MEVTFFKSGGDPVPPAPIPPQSHQLPSFPSIVDVWQERGRGRRRGNFTSSVPLCQREDAVELALEQKRGGGDSEQRGAVIETELGEMATVGIVGRILARASSGRPQRDDVFCDNPQLNSGFCLICYLKVGKQY